MFGLFRPTAPLLGRSHLTLPDGKPRYPPQRRLSPSRLAPRGPSYFELEQNRRIKWFMQQGLGVSQSLARRLVNHGCRTWADAVAKADDPGCKKIVFGRRLRAALEEREVVNDVGEVQWACPRGCEVDDFCECI